VPPTTAAALPSSTVDPESAKAKSGVGAPADLAAVSLPDPAPGFPLRRSTDQGPEPTGVTGGTFWTQAFLVGKTPDRVIGRDADGRPNSFAPTGPEATVLVIDGAATTDGTVVGHTQVGGRPATFVHYEGENGLSFHAGRFVVQVWGFGGVTNDELVALAGALHGLPS
jgi:hypothetical protein